MTFNINKICSSENGLIKEGERKSLNHREIGSSSQDVASCERILYPCDGVLQYGLSRLITNIKQHYYWHEGMCNVNG